MFEPLPQLQAVDASIQVGRRGAPRLRLAIPARIVGLYESQYCILRDLSRTGAQVAIENPLDIGEGALLKCAMLDHFGLIVRKGHGSNGLHFDTPFEDTEVLAIRSYAASIERIEKHELREIARSWVQDGI